MRFASSLTMKLGVLGCLWSATLAGGACGGRGGAPTGPSASAPAASVGAAADGQLPFHGTLDGTDTDTVAFPFLSVHLTATGNATHLGDYTAVVDFRVDLRTPTSPAVGTFTLTAANGDTVFGDLLGRASIANGIATVAETATITGGTGRFTNVSGGFTTARTVVQATGVSSGSFDGTIDLH